jgi:hypothetical protein
MKIVKYNPKKTFGLAYKVYPWVDENATPKGWELNFNVSDDGKIEVYGNYLDVSEATEFLNGLAEAIKLASEVK